MCDVCGEQKPSFSEVFYCDLAKHIEYGIFDANEQSKLLC